MRNAPVLIRAIAAETAAQLVVDAALRHLLQRERHHFQYLRITCDKVTAQTEFQLRGMQELWRITKTAVHGIESLLQLRQCLIERLFRKYRCCRARRWQHVGK